MLRYLLRRIVLFLPTLLVLSLLAFGLSKIAPGDPVELLLRGAEGVGGDIRNRERVYAETAAFLGLNKPPFYFTVTSLAYPDTLYRIPQKGYRENLQKLVAQYGNWEAISKYNNAIQQVESFLYYQLPDSVTFQEISILRSNVRGLYVKYRDNDIQALLKNIKNQIQKDSVLQPFVINQVEALQASYEFIKQNPTRSKLYIPAIQWYGFDNQYHNWITNFVQGDFGVAYTDGRPVADKMNDALYWTLVINGIAILLGYLLSIPLGVFTAVRKDTFGERFVTLFLFLLYSLPVFWIATLSLVFSRHQSMVWIFFLRKAWAMCRRRIRFGRVL